MVNILRYVVLLVAVAWCAYSQYSLPNNNADCPGNCRQIPWLAGSDQWNSGVLPTYTGVSCTAGLTEGDGTTDNTSAIQACLDALSASQAAVLPAGIYYVNGAITVPTQTVLRGAGSTNCSQGTWLSPTFAGDTGVGAACTTLKLGASGNVVLGTTSTRGSELNISSGYTKGATVLTLEATTGLSLNDWVSVFEDGSTTIPTDNGGCTWCGENSGSHLIAQFAQITNIDGNDVTIGRPLYYTFEAGQDPAVKEITWSRQKAGVESLKIHGFADITNAMVSFTGCLFCWVDDIETYNAGTGAKDQHINVNWSHGVEIRDSYLHLGRASSSDRNYGIGFFFWNSDHKVENNILREHRHSWSQEGGGAGSVFLYNYVDDNWTDDETYLGSPRGNHGAHPIFTLYEGNSVSHFAVDDVWGTSSHGVLFRNWLWGDATGNYAGWTESNPSWGFVALELEVEQTYYAAVGNVLGRSDNLHADWDSATVHNASCGGTSVVDRGTPMVFGFGCNSSFSGTQDTTVRSTAILHGNYDYKTNGVADWDGGEVHTLDDSLYYAAKPDFFGYCSWPVYGPEPTIGTLPARDRYLNGGVCASPPPATSSRTAGARIAGGRVQ